VRIVRIRFADSAFVDLLPTRGYILYAVPREHLGPDRGAVAVEGRREDGSLVGRVSFPHLKGH